MNSTRKPITTKSGQRFEFFDSLEEALSTLDNAMEGGVYDGATLYIEYADGTNYVRDGYIVEGSYKKTDITVLLLNPEKGVVQIYGECRITDIDEGKEYNPDTDTPDKVYCASGKYQYVYPAFFKRKA